MRLLAAMALVVPALALAEITLEAPTSAVAGASIEVRWQGESDRADFLTIVPEGTAEGTYDGYQYARRLPTIMVLPEDAGTYELRYLGKDRPYPTLARVTIVATPATASLDVQASIAAGADLSVTFAGPVNERDFITIVKADTPEREYASYVYAKRGNPATLRAPDEPGDYEVRYLTGKQYKTLARASVSVTTTTAAVTVADTLVAGADFSVSWEGPDNPNDWVGIFRAGAGNREYTMYRRTARGNPLTLRAPDEPGDYEIRYLTGQTNTTLAMATVVVGGTTASVSTDSSVMAGAEFEVRWDGPDNPNDWLGIFPSGADNRSYAMYRRASRGNPVTLRAPDAPGDYAVRYITGQSNTTLAEAIVAVTAVSASLEAPASVIGGEVFRVGWDGPDNRGDFVGLTQIGAPDDRPRYADYDYTWQRNPAELRAPLEPGDYELRYVTGQAGNTLARASVRVAPPTLPPGELVVLPPASGSELLLGDADAVELILDASGSMLKRQGDKRRIEIAKSVLGSLVNETIPAGTQFALRVFGHKEVDSCRTDLEIPLAPLDAAQAMARIDSIQAMNLARTPIADSLARVADDLAGIAGQRLIVLVTDGEETCDGNASAVIERLAAEGVDVRINIVGFAIDDAALADTFRYWAELGNGSYSDATSAADLAASMAAALRAPFDVLGEDGEVVASGIVGGEPVSITAGSYRLRLRGNDDTLTAIVIASDERTTVTVD